MPMPRCSSMPKSFFWYEESSSALRCGGGARLVRGALGVRGEGKEEGAKYLDRAEDGVRLARHPNDYGTLLNRLGGIFDLEDAALRRASRGLASEQDGNSRALPQQSRGKGDSVQGDRVVVVVVPEHYEDRAVASLGFGERAGSWGGNWLAGGQVSRQQFVAEVMRTPIRCSRQSTAVSSLRRVVGTRVRWTERVVWWWATRWSTRRRSFDLPGSSSCRCSGSQLDSYWLLRGGT